MTKSSLALPFRPSPKFEPFTEFEFAYRLSELTPQTQITTKRFTYRTPTAEYPKVGYQVKADHFLADLLPNLEFGVAKAATVFGDYFRRFTDPLKTLESFATPKLKLC